jgi:hypothetical protein
MRYCGHIGRKICKFLKLCLFFFPHGWERTIDAAAQARTIALWANQRVCAGENGFYPQEHFLARDIVDICGRNFLWPISEMIGRQNSGYGDYFRSSIINQCNAEI